MPRAVAEGDFRRKRIFFFRYPAARGGDQFPFARKQRKSLFRLDQKFLSDAADRAVFKIIGQGNERKICAATCSSSLVA